GMRRLFFPEMRTTAQHPLTCGPPLRRWASNSSSSQPASIRASAKMANPQTRVAYATTFVDRGRPRTIMRRKQQGSSGAVMKRRVLAYVVVFGVVAFACFLGKRAFVMPAIHPHSGDGQYQNISFRLGPLAVPGYSIRMEEFELIKSHNGEY